MRPPMLLLPAPTNCTMAGDCCTISQTGGHKIRRGKTCHVGPSITHIRFGRLMVYAGVEGWIRPVVWPLSVERASGLSIGIAQHKLTEWVIRRICTLAQLLQGSKVRCLETEETKCRRDLKLELHIRAGLSVSIHIIKILRVPKHKALIARIADWPIAETPAQDGIVPRVPD